MVIGEKMVVMRKSQLIAGGWQWCDGYQGG